MHPRIESRRLSVVCHADNVIRQELETSLQTFDLIIGQLAMMSRTAGLEYTRVYLLAVTELREQFRRQMGGSALDATRLDLLARILVDVVDSLNLATMRATPTP